MPRKARQNQEHRIPVNDSALFNDLRAFALERDLTWADALRKLLEAAKRENEESTPVLQERAI